MNRYVKDKRDLPHPKPVQKVQLPDRVSRWKIVAIVVLLAVGAAALVYGFYSLLAGDSGWREIKANTSSGKINCSEDFVFMYNIGASGISVRTENRAIAELYTQSTEKAYQLFSTDEDSEDVHNICYLNRHPNEPVEVDAVLYDAFSLLSRYDSRYLYLGPVYAVYDNIFYSGDDSQLVDFDPLENAQVAEEFAQIAAYANDPEAVCLELLGDNQVCLHVSGDYLAYANAHFISDFIDFYWLKNAFITDYLADTMIDSGYTLGSISSYDGFVRNLDGAGIKDQAGSGEAGSQTVGRTGETDSQTVGDTGETDNQAGSGSSYAFNIYDRTGTDIFPAAVMRYTGAISIVYLRNYAMNSRDFQHYYELENGETRPPYIDPEDGLPKTARNDLVTYAKDLSCAEIVLKTAPYYVTEEFLPEAVTALAADGVYSIYCEDGIVYYNEKTLTLADVYASDEKTYRTIYKEK